MHDIARDSALLSQNKTLENLFAITCAHGDALAAIWLEGDAEKHWTFAQAGEKACSYAAWLTRHLPEGGFVAISMDTCKEWFPTFWGLILSGHNALLLDASMNDELALHLMNEAGCKAIITARERQLPGEICQICTADLFAAPDAARPAVACGDSVALCTSGTTGTSRIFVYNGEAMAEQVLSSLLLYNENKRIVANENRRALAFLPFHHVLGFVVNLMWCGFLGYANIYLKDRAPKTILTTAQRCRPHLIVAVPLLANNLCTTIKKKLDKESAVKRAAFSAMTGMSLNAQRIAPSVGLHFAQKMLFKGLLKKALGTDVLCVILGGSHTPVEHLRMLNALGYYTVCGFGMTETAVTSVETSMSLKKRLTGSVGKPLTNVEYVVEGQNSEGEMRIRGASIHSGRMSGGRLLPPDTSDGWYPTGDIVRLRKDGRVFIQGRCKDVIINESGENVYPDELEDVFSALPRVEQAAVLGVPKPDGGMYEDITLVLSMDVAALDDAALSELASEIRNRNSALPSLKRLSRCYLTDDKLPLVNGIKVKRLELKKRILEGGMPMKELDLSAAAARLTERPVAVQQDAAAREGEKAAQENARQRAEIQTKVRACFAEALEQDVGTFGDDAHFIDDLGGDSLQVLSITLKAEELFGVTIETGEYGDCATVNSLTRLICRKLNGGAAEQPKERVERRPITKFEDSAEFQAFYARQQALMASGSDNPYFVCHDSPLLDKSIMAGEEVLNFGSYNYVGMSGRKEVNEAAKAAIDAYGTSASGSRLLAGEKSLHGELEREIADWKHAEAALVCVGGHSTNVTIVGNFCGPNDLIVYDALAHNSIEQGCRLSPATVKPFPHNDTAALESILRTQRKFYEKVLIIIEGAYSMDGDIADVPAFVRLKKEYGCFLMVDEAHSACVIGQTGGGVDEYFGLAPDDVDIKMGTLSKGLGTCGGYLAGRKCLIEYLRYNLPGFVFSVGLSPALAAGTLAAVRLLRREPQIMEGMRRNIKCFADEARRHRMDICLAGETAIIPVLIGKDEDAFALSNEMRRRGVFVPPAVYPAVPKNKARLRFCVISEHQPEQIVRALNVLEEAAEALGIQLPRRDY
ncbi:MAG: aminotransferase class I/II-fold pyridoxal phosphate-dependent enzyme [Clostridiales bacterium]|nr:aminotransferase class I/II-fold pyridoxal phosphate-dependent enzyme [Clostridiales bacterium]